MEKRNVYGTTDYEGKKVGTLRVGRIVSTFDGPRRRLRWGCVCERCCTSGQSFYSDELEQTLLGRTGRGAAVCKNPGCGREHIAELAQETAAKALRAENERQAKITAAREAAFQKSLDEIKLEWRKKHDQLAALTRESVLKLKDDALVPDPRAPKKMSRDAVPDFNNEQFLLFEAANPTANLSHENRTHLASYFERNGVNILSKAQFQQAFERLEELGLLQEARLPKAPVHRQPASVQPQPDEEPKADKIIGYDGTNGATREFTAFEVSQMSGEEYRKAFFRRTL